MKLSPEEYGAYWGGAVRIAAGALLAILTYRWVGMFLNHPEWGARLLGWGLLAMAVLVASFAIAIGLGRIVRAAVDAAHRR